MVLRENKTQKRAAGAKKKSVFEQIRLFFLKIKNISKKKKEILEL